MIRRQKLTIWIQQVKFLYLIDIKDGMKYVKGMFNKLSLLWDHYCFRNCNNNTL